MTVPTHNFDLNGMTLMEGKLNGLDLFSGIGGISLALAPWVKTIAYCEKDPYAQQVLLSRMAEGWIDLAPVWQTVDWINHARAKVLP